MDIKSWKIMLAVDDYGSFTRVGAELGYTQSGITQMMTWLRGWEGVHWLDSEKPEQARDEVLQVVGAIAG